MTERFAASDAYLSDFADEVLVVCPACGGRVRVVVVDGAHRAACPACAWTREAREPTGSFGAPYDPWLGLPLWLQTPVAGEVLWAFNEAHLALLESYVRADLRERGGHDAARPRPMTDRLPRWIKAAKHRDEVLAGVTRLRQRLAHT